MLRFARICRIVGLVLIGLGIAGAGVGLVRTWQARSASGLSAADKARIESNGLAEALYNMSFAVLLGAVPLSVGWWAGRRARQRP